MRSVLLDQQSTNSRVPRQHRYTMGPHTRLYFRILAEFGWRSIGDDLYGEKL
jgi:hypothetical protein